MPNREDRARAFLDFRNALRGNPELETKFRTAFPQLAKTLMDDVKEEIAEEDLTDEALEAVAGGIGTPTPVPGSTPNSFVTNPWDWDADNPDAQCIYLLPRRK